MTDDRDGDLARAVFDYRWLLDRGYPDRPALQLVGDRYRLSAVGRGMLYRGVFGREDSERRAARIASARDAWLTVDGHNVLFTAWNCLAGRPIVRATDGFIRDIGGTRTRLPHDERFTRVARLLCEALSTVEPEGVSVLLDEQLPWSREHAAEIRQIWERISAKRENGSRDGGRSRPVSVEIDTHTSVDAEVAAVTDGLIATSDTAIIDRCAVGAFDLGAAIVLGELAASPIDMSGYL